MIHLPAAPTIPMVQQGVVQQMVVIGKPVKVQAVGMQTMQGEILPGAPAGSTIQVGSVPVIESLDQISLSWARSFE